MPFMKQSQSNQLLLSCSRPQHITDDFLYRFHIHYVRKRIAILRSQLDGRISSFLVAFVTQDRLDSGTSLAAKRGVNVDYSNVSFL